MKTERRRVYSAPWLGVGMLMLAVAGADATSPSMEVLAAASLPGDLTSLSLEELMQIEVTSVSRRAESLSDAAAAVFVLTGDQIRRSGARSLPEILRLVPGLTVAQFNRSAWGVTARGFNGSLADKLEVRLDGRTLYTPLFSGVQWAVHDTFLGDIERIEVVRGPGGSLWGANAVNGVINIVTKSALDTTGVQAAATLGRDEDTDRTARIGHQLSDDSAIRAYISDRQFAATRLEDDSRYPDGRQLTTLGFRYDRNQGSDSWTLQGDTYDGELDTTQSPVSDTETVAGHNLGATWSRDYGPGADLTIRALSEYIERIIPGHFEEEREQVELEAKHRYRLSARHELVWGGGYRRSSDAIVNTPRVGFDPAATVLETFNVFVQDQFDLTPKARITLGSKFEHNDFTGLEAQPTVRGAYVFNERATLWGAVSRAVRAPNRVDAGFVIPVANGPDILGSDDFESETVIAYELGYRLRLGASLSMDLSTYFNDYDKLRGTTIAFADDGSPEAVLISNEGEGEALGGGIVFTWVPSTWLTAWLSYDYLDLDVHKYAGSTDTSIEGTDGNDPQHQAALRVAATLGHGVVADAHLRYVGELPNQVYTADGQTVDAYTELNGRLAWQASDTLEFALAGRNLLNDSHREYGGGSSVELERNLLGTVRFRF